MKSAQSNRSARSNPRSTRFNSPSVKLKVDASFYVEAFNTLVDSLIGPNCLRLDCLENLKEVLSAYEVSLDMCRTAGNVELTFCYAQVVAFLKKLELPLFGDEAELVAANKWYESEAACKDLNEKCLDILRHPLTHSHAELADAIQKVRSEITKLIGDMPPDLPEIVQYMRFGPHADLSHSREEGSAPFKLLNFSAYESMREEVEWLMCNTALGQVIPHSPVMACIGIPDFKGSVDFVDSALYTTVPKTVSEVRPIEIGPSLAGFVQQGYDGFLRVRLKEWGLDLTNQHPNRHLARRGSILGAVPNSPCTIDLSSASDRIAHNLVGLLLPLEWFNTLKRYRAKLITMPDGTSVKLEKFSSMGNAYTFSLQTLIFSAVVRSVLRERGWEGSSWRVYGDDIIVPYRVYNDVVRRLELFGFKVNQSKSFAEGNFRESCGADFLHGVAVRPFYLKKPIRSVADVYKYVNLLQLAALHAPIQAELFRKVFDLFLGLIPDDLFLIGDTCNALDSCVWSPYGPDVDLVLRRREESVQLPEKLGLLSFLLTGSTSFAGSGSFDYESDFARGVVGLEGAFGELEGWLRPIRPHVPPSLTNYGGYVIRRAPARGLVSRPVAREALPFMPNRL